MAMNRIDVPNTHALHDPAHAHDQAMKHFSPWLDVGRAIESYGADLLLRAMTTSAESVAALVVIGGMFRQVLVAADGALLCLEHGAVQQSMLHSRSMYEASIGIQWTLQEDWERRARQYYVSSLRQNRTWLQRQIPGTTENLRFEKAWEKMREPRRSDELEPEARNGLAEIDQLLREPDYREINEWFEQYGKRRKGKHRYFAEPYWYQPGPGGAQSIGMLARAVGREAEYATIYKYTSYFVHGSLAENHFKNARGPRLN